MSINGVSMVQSVYQYTKIAKSTDSGAVAVTKTTDTVNISPEAMREAKIAAFLKDKPYSAYKYDWMQRNRPDEAGKFIDTLIDEYDLDRNVPSPYPYFPKERDSYASGLGYKTVEDVKKGMEQGNVALGAQSIMEYLCRLDATQNTLREDGKDPYLNLDSRWRPSGAYLNAYKEDFSFYKEMKVDPETAEVWFLPKDGGDWMPKAEFEKANPDYKASISIRDEFYLASQASPEAAVKYIEKFIAGLSEEDKAYIKNQKLFNNPAFRNLGIDGLEEFTTSYDDVEDIRPYYPMTDMKWIVNNDKYFDYFDVKVTVMPSTTESGEVVCDRSPENLQKLKDSFIAELKEKVNNPQTHLQGRGSDKDPIPLSRLFQQQEPLSWDELVSMKYNSSFCSMIDK